MKQTKSAVERERNGKQHESRGNLAPNWLELQHDDGGDQRACEHPDVGKRQRQSDVVAPKVARAEQNGDRDRAEHRAGPHLLTSLGRADEMHDEQRDRDGERNDDARPKADLPTAPLRPEGQLRKKDVRHREQRPERSGTSHETRNDLQR